MILQSPVLLRQDHQINSFVYGETVLDEWLKRRALANNISGASRTFVVADDNHEVMGYYALAAGAVTHQESNRAIRQNMPDPIPVMVLARLAVDVRAQGMKLGAALLRDAVQRCIQVSQNAGVRALLVHAFNDKARQFYEHYGFQAAPAHPMTLMLNIRKLQ
ncbi:MAG: GNAT family N-acetyltransferase [Betaproteobacteria bacterium]|nr:GNAT family N-acetyltransferase [Betaproteobacteria bacterium]